MASGTPESWGPSSDHFFKILLRDINPDMVAAWRSSEAFGESFSGLVEVAAEPTNCMYCSRKSLLFRPHVVIYSKELQQ